MAGVTILRSTSYTRTRSRIVNSSAFEALWRLTGAVDGAPSQSHFALPYGGEGP